MIAMLACTLVASVTPAPRTPPILDDPRPLTAEGLENLVALAQLFGIVRYFHPSDQVEQANWEALAIGAVDEVEGAADATDLAEILQRLFAPVAPTLRVFTGTAPEPPAELRRPEGVEQPYLRAWRHVGLGLSVNNIYSSQRSKERLDGAEMPDGWSAPGETYEVELGRGVSARVPLTLFDDGQGTLPRVELPHFELPAGQLGSGDERATRLADVILTWNVFEHFSP